MRLIICLALALIGRLKADELPLPANDSVQVESPYLSVSLSDPDTADYKLNWGKPSRGIKIAALLTTPHDARLAGQKTFAVSFLNQSGTDLIIPLVARFPALSIYTSGKIRRLLYKSNPAAAMGLPDFVKLQSGKMITFVITNAITFDKDRVPMIVAFKPEGWGVIDIPASEKGLAVESREIVYP